MASGNNPASNQEPLEARLDKCRHRMSSVCDQLHQQLQQPQRSQQLLPVLKELWQTYSRTTRDFPDNEDQRQMGHTVSMQKLVGAAGGEVMTGLLALLERLIKSHLDGKLEAAPEEASVLAHVLSGFHNFSDCSVDFVRVLAASDTFCSGCCLAGLRAWQPLFLAGKLGAIATKSMRQLLDITYNSYFKMDTETDSHLAGYDFVEPAKPLLQIEDERMSFSALLLVCFALDESKAEYYLGQKKSISLLIRTLNKAIGESRRRCLGYHVIELTKCVNRLALNDVNKELLVELELLPVLHRLLDSGKADEASAAVDVLFTLSFSATVATRLRREFAPRLQKLSTQPEWSGSTAMQGLQFALAEPADPGQAATPGRPATSRAAAARAPSVSATAGKEAKADVDATESEGFDAMISYQHECRETVTRIRDQLRQEGVRVWVDYEQMMDGSTLSAMADAVESSTLVLMCMSRRYKDSNNCRLEAEYAWRNGKKMLPLLMERSYKPNGWLGLVLGAGLYYDFSGKYPFEAKFPELLSIVRKSLALQEPLDSVDASATGSSRQQQQQQQQQLREHATPSPQPPPLPPIGKRAISVRGWGEAEVAKWLTEHRLAACLREARLTGLGLQALLTMRQRAPEAFYATVERRFPFKDFMQLAEFLEALEEL